MSHPGSSQEGPVQAEEAPQEDVVESLLTAAEVMQPTRTARSEDHVNNGVALATQESDTLPSQKEPTNTCDEVQAELTVSQPSVTHEDSVYDVIESVVQQARAASGSDNMTAALTPSQELDVGSEKPCDTAGAISVCSKKIGTEEEEQTGGVYICPVCSRECSAQKYLKLHLLKHENDRQRPLDCNMCGKTFSTHQSMKLHRYTHTGEKPYACKICHRHFRQAGTLKRHMVTHTGDQPHRCPHCPRQFSQRSSLAAHLSLHTEQNSYLCVHCGKNFKTERYLKRHLIYHTDRRPFSCELCDKRFRTRLNMRRHMLRIHLLTTKKICKCLTCGAEMQNPGALKNHMAVHANGRKPYRAYVCEICSRRFQQRSKLKKHKQEKHGGGDELEKQPGVQPQVRADQVCRVMTRTNGQQRVTTYEMIPKDLDQYTHIIFPVNGRPPKDLELAATSGRRKSTKVPSTSVPEVIELNTSNAEQTLVVDQATGSTTASVTTSGTPLSAGGPSCAGGPLAAGGPLSLSSPSAATSSFAAGVPLTTGGLSGALAAVNPLVSGGLTAAVTTPGAMGTPHTSCVFSTVAPVPAAFAATNTSLPSNSTTLVVDSQSVLPAVSGTSAGESVSETLAALRALAAQEGDMFPPADFGTSTSGGHFAIEQQQSSGRHYAAEQQPTSNELGNASTSSISSRDSERRPQQTMETSVNPGTVDTVQQTGGANSGPDTPGTRIRVESQNQALLSRVLLAGKGREKRPVPGTLWEGGEISCKTCGQGFQDLSKFQEHLKKFGKITYWETTEGGDKVMGLRCVSGKKVSRKERTKRSTKKKLGKGRKTTNSLGGPGLVPVTRSASVSDTGVTSSQDAQTLNSEHSYQKPYGEGRASEQTLPNDSTAFTDAANSSHVPAVVSSVSRESAASSIQSSQGDTSVNSNISLNIRSGSSNVESIINAERSTGESCEERTIRSLNVGANSSNNSTTVNNTVQEANTTHEPDSKRGSVENGRRKTGPKQGGKKKETPAGKGAVCPTCGMQFAYKSSLRTHQFIHSGEKPYPCTVCRKAFRQAGDLQRHLAVHTGERRYTCQICKKGYKQSGDLAAHMMDHTDDIRFSCPVCSKRLKRKCDLRKHMYTHTGFFPFQCDLCGKQFREKAKMLNHKRNKHGAQKIFVCEVCGKQFNHPGCLKNHLRKHTGNKPHVCTVCSKGYVQRGKLVKHMRTHQQTTTTTAATEVVPQWGLVEEVVLQDAGGVNLMDQGYEENMMNVFRTIEAAQALTFMPEAVVEIQL